MSQIQISGFPLVSNSTFTGRAYGKIEVEQVNRAGRSAGSGDYVVLLRDRFNPTHRAVVSYTRFLTAIRAADPSIALLNLYAEARASGLHVAARIDATGSKPTMETAHIEDEVCSNPASPVSQPIAGDTKCETPAPKDKDWAFDRMTELLRVAMYNREVADVIKRLTSVL